MIALNSHLKYAKALYTVALKNGAEQAVLSDLEHLNKLFKHKHFADAVKKITFIKTVDQAKILAETFGAKINKFSLNLLLLLAKNRKLWLVPNVAESYRQYYHEGKKIKDLRVVTARKLDHDEEKSLEKKLEEKIKSPVSVRFEENPELIGGMQIFERGHLTDFSVKNYLETMKKHLLVENA